MLETFAVIAKDKKDALIKAYDLVGGPVSVTVVKETCVAKRRPPNKVKVGGFTKYNRA